MMSVVVSPTRQRRLDLGVLCRVGASPVRPRSHMPFIADFLLEATAAESASASSTLGLAAALIPAPPRVPNWGSCSVTYRSSFVSSRRVV